MSLLILHVNLRDSSPRWLNRRLLNSPFPTDISKHHLPVRTERTESLFKEMIAKNFPNLGKEYPDPESTDPKQEEFKEVHTKAHDNSKGKT